jgi:hypothetical protein
MLELQSTLTTGVPFRELVHRAAVDAAGSTAVVRIGVTEAISVEGNNVLGGAVGVGLI